MSGQGRSRSHRSSDPLEVAFAAERKPLEEKARRIVIGLLAAFVGVVVVLILINPYSPFPGYVAFNLVGIGALLVLFPGSLAVHFFVVARAFAPARVLCGYAAASLHRGWAEIDGDANYTIEPEAIRGRLGDRSDDLSVFMRIGSFVSEGRADEARSLLDDWRPTDQLNKVRRARLAEQIDFASPPGEGGNAAGITLTALTILWFAAVVMPWRA
jgi:hypothetical protein